MTEVMSRTNTPSYKDFKFDGCRQSGAELVLLSLLQYNHEKTILPIKHEFEQPDSQQTGILLNKSIKNA